ncbi:P-loop containing nucleoside triphosphate hydrolase protein, partial [Rhodocollybia butyracea]
LLGGTGTGKTSFVNLAGASKFLVGRDLESCTQNVQYHQFIFGNKDVILIDVPGFDDTNKSDIEILTIIGDFLATEHRRKRALSGILYFHRISDVRMGGAARRNLDMFQKLCGSDAFKNVAVVTTRWDQEERSIAEARLAELKTEPDLFKPIIESGGTIFRHDHNSIDSANKILSHLINKSPVSLLIQREIVDKHKELAETTAGKMLQRDIMQQVEKHQKELDELMEEMGQGNEDSEELEDERSQIQESINHLNAKSLTLANARWQTSSTPGSTQVILRADQVPMGGPSSNREKPYPTPPAPNHIPTEDLRSLTEEIRSLKEKVQELQTRAEDVDGKLRVLNCAIRFFAFLEGIGESLRKLVPNKKRKRNEVV